MPGIPWPRLRFTRVIYQLSVIILEGGGEGGRQEGQRYERNMAVEVDYACAVPTSCGRVRAVLMCGGGGRAIAQFPFVSKHAEEARLPREKPSKSMGPSPTV